MMRGKTRPVPAITPGQLTNSHFHNTIFNHRNMKTKTDNLRHILTKFLLIRHLLSPSFARPHHSF